MVAAADGRTVDIPRTVVFFCVAGLEGALQTDGNRRDVGGAATVDEHGRFHLIFWTAGEIAFRRLAVSRFLFLRLGSLDIFFDGADNGNQRSGGKPAVNYKGIFPATNFTSF